MDSNSHLQSKQSDFLNPSTSSLSSSSVKPYKKKKTTMLTLRKLSHKPTLLLCITSRFFTSQTPNLSPSLEEPSSAHYDQLLSTAGRSRDFAAVHHLLNKRFKDGCFSTTKTFNFITNTETEADLPPLLDELCQTLARLNGGFTRKSAFDSLISRLCKLNRIDESLRVVNAMVRGKFGANVHSFYPILSALTRKRRMEEAWRVIGLMRENEVSPDRTAYNFLLTSYCVVGDLTAAAGVLSEMEREGLTADSRTYDAMVLGACKAGKVEGAMVVLRRMEDDGVPLLYCTHVHVINALVGLGYYAQAVEFVMGYGGREKGLDTESFGILASRLISVERFEEAKLVLKEMKKMGLVLGCKLDDFYRTHLEN